VGESGRSLKERAGEHWQDAISNKEESHMIKHWMNDHPEEKKVPVFKFKIVSSFKDALTRQVAESVRIDIRGQNVLNSRTEFSRCHLPRLTIDLEEWEKHCKARDDLAKAEQESKLVDEA
jgi:hypothetical protein